MSAQSRAHKLCNEEVLIHQRAAVRRVGIVIHILCIHDDLYCDLFQRLMLCPEGLMKCIWHVLAKNTKNNYFSPKALDFLVAVDCACFKVAAQVWATQVRGRECSIFVKSVGGKDEKANLNQSLKLNNRTSVTQLYALKHKISHSHQSHQFHQLTGLHLSGNWEYAL